MFESWKLKRSIKRKELEYQEQSIIFATDTMKTITSATRVVQDEDDAQWIVAGSGEGGRPDEGEHTTMLEQAFKMWRSNLQARAIVRNMVKFVIGRGTIVKAKDDNAKATEYWDRFRYEGAMDSPQARNKWNHREKEIFTRLFRDGEFLLREFVAGKDEKGLVRLRFIRPGRVQTPTNIDSHNKGEIVSYGIGHNPDDIEDLKTYYLVNSDGTLYKKVPAEEIIHYKIFADSDMKRGISVLEVCAPMIQKYDGWMEDRITLNKVRTAIALIRKIDAPTARIQAIRDSLEAETVTADRKKQKMLERGTIITASKGVEYEMLSPNINATDVKDDGRNMLLSVAAGVGFPEMILTADYSNANYSSTLIAQNPFVREIEDWQDFAKTIYQDIYSRVI
ncbi:MAG: phage portal protein, partial [Candidatus Thorarchaeota archaeon]